MTNSIASSKCPTVLSSGKYGMAQNRFADDSKEYIFVKLTDSAYRAVEEYNAKRFPNGQCAKIQVEGNSGFIQFPTLDSAKGDRKFGFTLDDVDGSLECIQQTSDGLDVLGSLSYRMRIHANDDIYDTTRTKMAIAEETEKSKCIREIKPNQTDIGRKVKKSSSSFHHHSSSNQSGNVNSGNSNNNSSNFLSNSNSRSKLISPSNNSSHLNGATSSNGVVVGASSSRLGPASSSSSRSPNPTMLGGSGTVGSSTSNPGNNNNCNRYASHGLYSQSNVNSLSSSLPSLTSASSLSSTFAGGISNGYSSVSTGSPPDPLVSVTTPAPTNKSKLGSGNYGGGGGSNGRGNGGGGINGPLSGTKGGGVGKSSGSSSGGSKLPDISRRKIRERLIHLLALKPFKKPELYSRLTNEGIRDRERSLISNVLKDISTMSRDNTYNLRRQMWNDVNENWPFYTEQELQQLKRRKPQNLTPPISDAGSSTSGQSPTSTHTGSPPPLVGGGGSGLKRASLEGGGYDESALMGTQPKKQRISHFKKDAMAASTSSCATGSSIGLGGANRIGGYSGNGSNVPQNKNVLFSPHGHSAQGVDDNSHNSDITFNVLENGDDFMSHVEQGSSNYFGGAVPPSNNNVRKANGGVSNANNKNAGSVKEKRSAGIGQQQERTSNKELMKKSCSSPTPYVMNFVPESKTSLSGSNNSRVGANGVGTNNSSNNNFQHNSPNSSQQHHKSNSVMSKQAQNNSPRDEANSSNRSSSGSMGRYAQPLGGRSSAKSTRTSTPPIQQQQQHPQIHQQQQHQQIHQQQPHHSQLYHHQPSQKQTSLSSPPLQQQQHQQQQHQQQQYQPSQQQMSIPSPPLQQQQHHQQQQQQLPPPQYQQQHASPTQQIAAAASSYASAANGTSKAKPSYDFSNYTPITSIAQRRKYKTEFETDYDEYRKLLAQIEGVGRHFRELAEKLENARQGCADYDEIKQRIVSEYEKIQNEETLKNDKLRFDYLHAKLAHIKQSVTDYDNALTAAAAALQKQELLQQQQAQQQPQQQQQYSTHIETIDTNNVLAASRNSRLSPMVSGGESNNSPPSYHQQQQQLPTQSQQQYATHYQQHHDAETIQQQHTHPHAVTTTQHHPPPTSEQQSLPSPSNNINSNNTATQQYQQPHQYHNGGHHASRQSSNSNDCNSDSDDSSDSSDSNSNDEDDDDDSNSNSNSNDEEDNDDDNDHY